MTCQSSALNEVTGKGQMKYYTIAEIEIHDRSWVSAYVQQVTKLVEARGGRYLARTSNVEQFEGTRKPPSIVLLIEWPSREVATAFYDSEEYRPFRDSRLAGASNELLLVAGEDITGRAQIADQAEET